MNRIKIITIISLLFGCGEIYAQNGAINGFCEKGATPATTSGLNSTNTLDGIVPGGPAGCLVQVYLTGTVTPATIFSNISGGTLTNPFRATLSGQWLFFAATSSKYDVVLSSGLPPNAYTTPVILTGLGSGTGGGGGGGGCSVGGISTTNGIVTGDTSSTNCGTNNRASDTATSPADVQTFGYTNLTGNSGQFVVAAGNNNGAANPSSDTVLIGDTNGGSIPNTFPAPDNLLGIGNNNLNTLTGQISDLSCLGDMNCETIGWLTQSVGLGNANLTHDIATEADDLGELVGIGLSNIRYVNSGDSLTGIGQANIEGHISGGSTNVNEGVAIGDGNAAQVGNNVNDFICIGDGSCTTLANSAADIVAIGDGALKQCFTFTGCAGGLPNPTAVNDIVFIGDGAGSFDQASNVVGIGNQALGANTVGAGLGFYNQGSFNVAVGPFALVANSTGANNTALGGYAGCDGFVIPNTWANCNHTGSNNTWLGYDSGPNTTTQLSNTVAVGYQAHNTASNQAVFGNASMTDTELFGTTHVNGAAGVAGGIQLIQGTSSSTQANNVGIFAPTSVTAYNVFMPGAQGTGALTNDGSGNLSWVASGGSGTVTSIATTSPITGGTITTTGTIACATCVVSSSPGAGIAHFAGATQTVTSSAVSLTADVSGNLPNANLATQTANTVLGALTATTPSGLAMPSCSGATNALIWTSGTGFGCNTISGGGSTAFSALTGSTNTTAAMLVGSGASLGTTGTGTNQATILTSSETVSFSSTPTFAITTNVSEIALTGNITSFTLAAGAAGQNKILTFCQDATGSRTVAPPANVHGFFTVGSTASKCSSQNYHYSTGQTAWLSDSPGTINE